MKKRTTKLRLSKETVSILRSVDPLDRVHGGTEPTGPRDQSFCVECYWPSINYPCD